MGYKQVLSNSAMASKFYDILSNFSSTTLHNIFTAVALSGINLI